MKKPPGSRRFRDGVQAYVRVNGQLKTKMFPRDTPQKTITAWREDTRTDMRRGRPTSVLEVAPLYPSLHRQPLPARTSQQCYIYFIQDEATIKIGRALDPVQRFLSIQSSHPRPLSLLAVIVADATYEQALHQRFHQWHIRGEWFALNEDLIQTIQQARQQ